MTDLKLSDAALRETDQVGSNSLEPLTIGGGAPPVSLSQQRHEEGSTEINFTHAKRQNFARARLFLRNAPPQVDFGNRKTEFLRAPAKRRKYSSHQDIALEVHIQERGRDKDPKMRGSNRSNR